MAVIVPHVLPHACAPRACAALSSVVTNGHHGGHQLVAIATTIVATQAVRALHLLFTSSSPRETDPLSCRPSPTQQPTKGRLRVPNNMAFTITVNPPPPHQSPSSPTPTTQPYKPPPPLICVSLCPCPSAGRHHLPSPLHLDCCVTLALLHCCE